MNRVVVTGLGTISAAGCDVASSWGEIIGGRSGISKISLFDANHLPVRIAGEIKNFDPKSIMDARNIRRSSRFIQIAIKAAKEALEDSSILESISGENVGCILGVGMGALDVIEETLNTVRDKGHNRVSPFFVPSVITNMAGGHIANQFGLKGPNLCISTACTSGTHAIGEAFQHIRMGKCKAVVCGGSESTICSWHLQVSAT